MRQLKKRMGLILILMLFSSGGAELAPAWGNLRAAHTDMMLVKNVSKEDMAALYDRLNLTEQQRLQLEENRRKHHARMKTLTDQLTATQQQLNKELERPVLDKSRIDQLKDQLDRLQNELTALRLKGILDVRAILTPEQYEIFTESMP